MGALMRSFDWASTPLGPTDNWPQSLRTATDIVLQSPVPIVMLWGEDGIMIYNDAYSLFAGKRHPELLGSKVREGWPEVADFNDNVMRVGLAGGTLAYRDQQLTLHRRGVPEQVWMNLDYSPVLDETGRPGGVIAIVVETTQRVLAERRVSQERDRLRQLFHQAPGFMAMLRGPEHVFELANPAYLQLIGHRDVIGKTVREALPEAAEQGFLELLDDAFHTGKAFAGSSMQIEVQRLPGGPAETRFIDFVYQPVFEGDRVTGIFVQGSDVTERVLAENRQRLLVDELNHRVKNTLATVQGIAGQTFRASNTDSEAKRSFESRLRALAGGHDLLTHEHWSGADLHCVVATALEPFRDGHENRMRIAGPDFRLMPKPALALTMALHELATNATKYGALSAAEGQVDISWADDGESLRLRWKESGGPKVVMPTKKGFGSRLIERSLSHELCGAVRLDYAPEGFSCEVDLPVARLRS